MMSVWRASEVIQQLVKVPRDPTQVVTFFDNFGAKELYRLLLRRTSNIGKGSLYSSLLSIKFWREIFLKELYERAYERRDLAFDSGDPRYPAISPFLIEYNRTFRSSTRESQRRLKSMLRRGLTDRTLDDLAFELSCLNLLRRFPGEVVLSDLAGENRFDFLFRGKAFTAAIEVKAFGSDTGARVKYEDVANIARTLLPALGAHVPPKTDVLVLVTCESSLQATNEMRRELSRASTESVRTRAVVRVPGATVETRLGQFPRMHARGNREDEIAHYDEMFKTFERAFGRAPLNLVDHPFPAAADIPQFSLGVSSLKEDRDEERLYQLLDDAANQLGGHENGLIFVELCGMPIEIFGSLKQTFLVHNDALQYSDAARKALSKHSALAAVVFVSATGVAPARETRNVVILPSAQRISFAVTNDRHDQSKKICRYLNLT